MGQILTASKQQHEPFAPLSVKRQGHPWDTLFSAETSWLTVPSAYSGVAGPAKAFVDGSHASVRIMGEKHALEDNIEKQLSSPLGSYITALLDTYDAFMDADILRIRLETVTSRACWKWHRDYTTLRLITTLHGQGTECLPDPAQPEKIARCQTGEVGLFKGRLFGDYFGLKGHEACVHRSPPWDESDDPRLLLVIDMPQDFEIEGTA